MPQCDTTRPRTGGGIQTRHEGLMLIRNTTEPKIAETDGIIDVTRPTRSQRLTRLTRQHGYTANTATGRETQSCAIVQGQF